MGTAGSVLQDEVGRSVSAMIRDASAVRQALPAGHSCEEIAAETE
jgi:hypothetical protein